MLEKPLSGGEQRSYLRSLPDAHHIPIHFNPTPLPPEHTLSCTLPVPHSVKNTYFCSTVQRSQSGEEKWWCNKGKRGEKTSQGLSLLLLITCSSVELSEPRSIIYALAHASTHECYTGDLMMELPLSFEQ